MYEIAISAVVRAVHPHTCGANVRKGFKTPGKRRFIPTHVGLMGHSRIIGGNRDGSSPHMWG